MKVAIIHIIWEGRLNLTQCFNECEIIRICDITDVETHAPNYFSKSNFMRHGFTLAIDDKSNYVVIIDRMLEDSDKNFGFIKNLTIFEKKQRKLKLEKLKNYEYRLR